MMRMLLTLVAVLGMSNVVQSADVITITSDAGPFIVHDFFGNYTIDGSGNFAAPANRSHTDADGNTVHTVFFTDAVRVRSRKNNVVFALEEQTTDVEQYGEWFTDTGSYTTSVIEDIFTVNVRAEGRKIVYKITKRDGILSPPPTPISGEATFIAIDW